MTEERLTPEEQQYEAFVADTHPTFHQCPECFGKTVLYKGKGLDSVYYICSRYREAGHKTDAEINAEITRLRKLLNPSGRFE